MHHSVRKYLKTFLLPVLIFFPLLLLLMMFRTTLLELPQLGETNLILPPKFDIKTNTQLKMERAKRFAGGLKIASISYDINTQNTEALLELHEYIIKNYPLIHKSTYISRSIINKYSLLYKITGTDNNGQIPYLLAAHLDVVPIDEKSWKSDPFAGNIIDNKYLYGRGSIDFKLGLFGILEAMEYMIENNIRSKRDYYVAFGHDEEVLGLTGAKEIAKELQKRGVNKIDFLVDEGTPIFENIFPGITAPLSKIDVSEKGYMSVELSVKQEPGHASFPPRHSAIGILSQAITRLENNPHPNKFGTGPEIEMFKALMPYMNFMYKLAMTNLWCFSGLVSNVMADNPKLNALIRTTTAVTMINGGTKENVLASEVKAIVNHRVHPTETAIDVFEYDRMIIDDPRVEMKILNSRGPLPISPYGSDDLPYHMLKEILKQTFPDVIVTPGVFIASTDTIHYANLTQNMYRIMPVQLNFHDPIKVHGNDEEITVDDFQTAIEYYYRIIRNADFAKFKPHMHSTDEL